MVHRRELMVALVAAIVLDGIPSAHADEKPLIEVFKLPNCVCCKNWIKYLKLDGYPVQVNDVANVEERTAVQDRFGVPVHLRACHTAIVAGYVVEGHVNLEEIAWLLRERPRIKGLFVTGMPKGAPGMEGGEAETYKVVAVDLEGHETVFANHGPDRSPP